MTWRVSEYHKCCFKHCTEPARSYSRKTTLMWKSEFSVRLSGRVKICSWKWEIISLFYYIYLWIKINFPKCCISDSRHRWVLTSLPVIMPPHPEGFSSVYGRQQLTAETTQLFFLLIISSDWQLTALQLSSVLRSRTLWRHLKSKKKMKGNRI